MPKPWKDKEPAPYQRNTDVDGGPCGGPEYFEKAPGEGAFHTPNANPTSDDTAKRKPGGIF